MIATGIGVTPFASILQSIMHRYWKARHTCPKCKYTWASEIPPTVMHLRKVSDKTETHSIVLLCILYLNNFVYRVQVDFFWINRDQRSFEWFVNLLSQLEIEQAELGGAMERFLEMHMYITSALQKTDMKAVGLQLALDLLHEKVRAHNDFYPSTTHYIIVFFIVLLIIISTDFRKNAISLRV